MRWGLLRVTSTYTAGDLAMRSVSVRVASPKEKEKEKEKEILDWEDDLSPRAPAKQPYNPLQKGKP